MKSYPTPHIFVFFTISVLLFCFALKGAAQEDAPSRDQKAEMFKKKGEGMSAWGELSEDEQKKLREGLRKVWGDPAVLSARENVNRSAVEYQKAIRESMGRLDPETFKILDRMEKSKSGGMHKPIGMPPGSRKRPYGGGVLGSRLEHIFAMPSTFEKMNDEQRKKFKEAVSEARKRSDVIKASAELRSLMKEDEELRKKKREAILKLRHTYINAIVELEPELREVIPPPGSHPEMPHYGKGKGKGGPPRREDAPPR